MPAREGTLRVLRRGPRRRGRADRRHLLGRRRARRRRASAPAPLTEADWTDADDPALTPYTRSKTIAERAAWDLVGERGESREAGGRQPRRDPRPGAERGPLLLAADGRAAAEGDARDPADRLQRRRRARRRRPPHQGDDRPRGRRRALHRRRPSSSGWPKSPRSCASASAPAAAKVPTRSVPDFMVRGDGRSSTPACARSSASSARGSRCRARRRSPARLVAAPGRGHDRRLRPQPDR